MTSSSTLISDEASAGTAAARTAIAEVQAGADPGLAWLRFIEVGVKHGRNSGACRAFVTQMARASSGLSRD